MAIGPGQPGFPFAAPSILANAPNASGVYALYNASRYVDFGESNDVQRRLSEHVQDQADCVNLYGATFFAFELHPTEAARVFRQNQLMTLYPTPCNQRFRRRRNEAC